MKLVLDVHTHTLVSGHAYSTIRENARMGKQNGMEVVGITEHAPQMPYSCGGFYFQNMDVIPRRMEGVRLLMGVELNIMDEKGTVDLPVDELRRMDVAIASLHPPCYGDKRTKSENMSAYLGVMKNPDVQIIGHPDDSRFPLDYEELATMAKEHGKLLEVNNSSLRQGSYRPGARENYEKMLEYCMKLKVPVILGSDAHVDEAVGKFENAVALLEDMRFPEELVINTSFEKLKPYLKCDEEKRDVPKGV